MDCIQPSEHLRRPQAHAGPGGQGWLHHDGDAHPRLQGRQGAAAVQDGIAAGVCGDHPQDDLRAVAVPSRRCCKGAAPAHHLLLDHMTALDLLRGVVDPRFLDHQVLYPGGAPGYERMVARPTPTPRDATQPTSEFHPREQVFPIPFQHGPRPARASFTRRSAAHRPSQACWGRPRATAPTTATRLPRRPPRGPGPSSSATRAAIYPGSWRASRSR